MSGRKLKKRSTKKRLKSLRKDIIHLTRELLADLRGYSPRDFMLENIIGMRHYKED